MHHRQRPSPSILSKLSQPYVRCDIVRLLTPSRRIHLLLLHFFFFGISLLFLLQFPCFSEKIVFIAIQHTRNHIHNNNRALSTSCTSDTNKTCYVTNSLALSACLSLTGHNYTIWAYRGEQCAVDAPGITWLTSVLKILQKERSEENSFMEPS